LRTTATNVTFQHLNILCADRISRLLAVNGLSLGFALIANFALLLNMARRLAFSIAQPITIVGWYVASILLIGDLTAIIHIVKIPGERRALTQAFYYAIFACGIYFIIASLMIFTVYGAYKGHYSKEFKLSMSQRTLMLQTISFMIYMVGGAGVYAKIEGWMFLDALYFTNYTLLTIGIGDYAPSTNLGRGLLFPYAIGGIVILGLVIGSIRSLVLERGKKKLGSRMVEKKREQHLKKMLKKKKINKLTPIENKQQADEVGMSERDRRQEEFNLMRQIQEEASTRQKWQALLVSGSAWFFLWFIGALIFYFAEHEQEWTYFGSLYFAYTTLLTIGYGDYKPFSNSGKAFFVFWSLLAVPTLTILISNMGDTVVKGIRDLTLYLGEITVLPGEEGFRSRVKQLMAQGTRGKLFGDEADISDPPPGLLGGQKEIDAEQAPSHPADAQARGTDFLAEEVQDEELKEAGEAKRRGDKLGENIHEYHYLLVQEFRNVMKHINESPPRKYTYDEWEWFLKLIGEDESNSTFHRQAPVNVKSDHNKKPDIQHLTNGDNDQVRQWSWIGSRSPLMGETEEAEWVLERLSITLENELKKQIEARRKDGGKDPDSADVAKNVMEPQSSSGSSDTVGDGRQGTSGANVEGETK
jgi:potassium channel subfamily K